MSEDVLIHKPKCRLSGTDGNVFAIIGKVSDSLKKAKQHGKSAEFIQRAMSQESYEDVLSLCDEYVEVS